MEKGVQESSDIEVLAVDNTESGIPGHVKVEAGDKEILTNGVLLPERKEESEEVALEGEFIKIEKEFIEDEKAETEQEEKPFATEKCSGVTEESRDVLETHEKKKDLELESERLAGVLKHPESENAGMEEEIVLIKEKLEESEKHCKELKQNQLIETEKYNQHLRTLQETLQSQDTKNKELTNVKEVCDGLTIELASSRKKVQELEQELQSSVGDAHKFEELSEKNSSHAASEMQRALEFERLLELAKVNAKEMEDQMGSLHEEVQHLYEKIAGNEQVEKALRSNEEELSTVRGYLELSKAEVLDLQQRLTSEEAVISKLTKEVELRKASEAQIKEDILALENVLSTTKVDLGSKVAELEELKLNLQKEIELREVVEFRSKKQEEHISTVQEEMEKFAGEKVALEAALKGFNINIMQMKESCGDLETKLKLSDENFHKTDSLLSQALLNNIELEEKLKSLEELHQESGSVAATATEKNLELEGIVGASNATIEEMKSQLREMETKLIFAEQKNMELEQVLNQVELKSNNAEREVELFSGKVSELNDLVRGIEDEKTMLQNQSHEYEDKIIQLETAMGQASLRTSDLEQELKGFQGKSTSLEVTLQEANEKEVELKECLNLITEEKNKFEKISSDSSRQLSEAENMLESLQNELKLKQEKLDSIEKDLKVSEIRESEVMEKLKSAEEQLNHQELLIEQTNAKKSELELLHKSLVIDSELKLQEAILNFTEKDSEAKSLYEKLEILENGRKIYEEKSAEAAEKSASLKAEFDEIVMKVATLENTILELQGKVSEAEASKSCLAETKTQLENKVNELQGLLNAASSEKEATLEQLISHMNTIAELTDQHSRACVLQSDAESRIRDAEIQLQEATERYVLRDLDAKDLNEKLDAFEAQLRVREEAANEASLVSDTRKVELQEALFKAEHLETIVQQLQSRSAQYDKECEGLAETNMKLAQELVEHESKLNDLQHALSAALNEKESTLEQLLSSKKMIEDLTEQVSHGGQKLQSQITSVTEENSMLKATYQDAKKEFEARVNKLQGEVDEQKATREILKAEVDNFKSELAEKSFLQARVLELEQQLLLVENRLNDEVESIKAVAAQKEAELISKLEDHADKVKDFNISEESVLQLQKDLSLAHTTISEQEEELRKLSLRCTELDNSKNIPSQTAEVEKKTEELETKPKLEIFNSQDQGKEEIQVKSRELPSMSIPSKRKSKKRSEATSVKASEVHAQPTSEVSAAINFKFIFGIALVSVILGIILGKRY